MGLEQLANALIQASWGSIFAGGVTALALSILMGILGVALGFAVVKPSAERPTSGLGMAFGGWSVLSIIVSMAGGGFIAGMFAGTSGMQHGFMVWALVLLAASIFGGLTVGGALRAVGSLLKGIGSGAAGAASVMGRNAASGVAALVTELKDSVHIHLDANKLSDDVKAVLIDTGVESLHPDHLKQQMREARSELRTTLHQLTHNPEDAESIINEFLTAQKNRVEALGNDIDRHAAVQAVMNTRHINQDDAEALVDDAIKAYTHLREKAKDCLHDARAEMEEAWQCLKHMSEQTRARADKWANAVAKTALMAAVALLVAAAISMAAGAVGARYSGIDMPPHKTVYIR